MKGQILMEEQQIREFVHRVSSDEKLQQALRSDASSVIEHQGFSPRVAKIVMRLVPQLALSQDLGPSLGYWN